MTRELRNLGDPLSAVGWGNPLFSAEAPLRTAILGAHHLLRALEMEVSVFEAAIGTDPLPAELRTLAARRRAELEELIDRLPLDPPMELTEPPEEVITLMAAHCRPEESPDDTPR